MVFNQILTKKNIMEVGFSVKCQSVFETKESGANVTANLKYTEYDLEVSGNLEESMYMVEQPDGSYKFTKAGNEVVTATLVTALVSNIHNAHDSGLIDSAAHLRLIIKKLEEGFVTIVHENEVKNQFTDISQLK